MNEDPALMTDDWLILEIKAAEEELDLLFGFTDQQAARMPFDLHARIDTVEERLDLLIAEESRRGLVRRFFRLV